ncbi:MAG: YdiU family protein [Gammaproteobacteria bacterium]|nr:YdiU family protein [Gammaproteobacteria bacterium]
MKTLEELCFNNTFSQLTDHEFYSKVDTTPLNNQHLISFNANAAALIGLDIHEQSRDDFCDIISGKTPLHNFFTLAMCYAGHQFGQFVPRLGDGRAILLGQLEHDNKKWDLQLKGAGPTPYSRGSDGRAVLRSTIREYLCSEAMHGLGIASSRALCMLGSDEEVYREQIESGAMLVRMAPSHIRFGTFEYFYYTNQHRALQELADYLITEHYPALCDIENPYLALLSQCIDNTALLIAQWQAVGFSHGVMNTDNMSIHGLTLDYGPFGFLDAFKPDYICNHSDYQGRYAFKNQPEMGLFNLSCLAQALLPLICNDSDKAAELARAELAKYQSLHLEYYHQLINSKLGLGKVLADDIVLQKELLNLLQQNQTDYTIFFRALSNNDDKLADMFIPRENFDRWFASYQQRLRLENTTAADRKSCMLKTNPKYILRNYLLETAIERANNEKNYADIENLLQVMSSPFDEHPEFEHFAGLPPEWASQIQLSCSS